MTREEIRRKFDEIVAFADIEKFLDTPVKRYSSGMYVRLAFAVAAHLEPEILLVDEVLAVGDAEFQKKCLGKMNDVAKSGRTVLFVSHNIGAIRALCKNALWLEQGNLKEEGPAGIITVNYMRGTNGSGAAASISKSQHLQGMGSVTIDSALLLDSEKVEKNSFLIGESFNLVLRYKVLTPIHGTFWVLVATIDGNVIFSSFQMDNSEPLLLDSDGAICSALGSIKFLPGEYVVSAGIFNSSLDMIDWVDGAARFQILPQFATGRAFDYRYGVITQELEWRKQVKE
jgi:lipopolysaccharide transport system ATP-binding protein